MERKYGFRERLLQVHKEDLRDFSITKCGDNETEIKSGVQICIPKKSGRVLKNAARDLADYLLTSMKIGAGIAYIEDMPDENENIIMLTTKEYCEADLKDADAYMGFFADIGDKITICGFDERGAAQGTYYLEDVMSNRRAPYLNKGSVYRKPLFSPRMVHSGYGLDLFPDEHLTEIAHAGMDAILVFVRKIDENATTYMDLNEIIYRAEGRGIDVYAYSYMKSPVHPEGDNAYSYYDGTYGNLFRTCPKLKGVILVGESVNFPSKEENAMGGSFIYGERELGKGRSEYYLSKEYPAWLSIVQKVIYKEKPDADIVLWTYNFNCDPGRIGMIRNMPKGISLLSTFEMPELFDIGNSKASCTDYTIAFEGPGKNFLEEARVAKECGIKLYSQVNTAGRTWDMGTVPYLPCPMQWKNRNDKILECREKYGLSGLMEGHHYGFFPSIISELAKEAFSLNGCHFEKISREIAGRDFGAENADDVISAWEKFSEAIRCCPTSVEDQYGPLRIGPAYPLSLNVRHNVAVAPYADNGNSIIYTMYQPYDEARKRTIGRTAFPVRIVDEMALLEKGIKLFDEGAELLEPIAKTENATRMVNLAKYMANTFRTTLNTKKWFVLKHKLLSVCGDKEEMNCIAKEMRVLAETEILNAEATLPLVDEDSCLGWEPSMEYVGDRPHIEMKIRQTKVMLDFELSVYEK